MSELDDKFDIAPTEEKENLPEVSEEQNDIEYVQKKMKTIIEIGGDALQDAASMAKSSYSPRSYEVLAQMIKAVSDATKNLSDINKNSGKSQPTQIGTQKNVFIGSTSDLLKMIRNDEEIVDVEIVEETKEGE